MKKRFYKWIILICSISVVLFLSFWIIPYMHPVKVTGTNLPYEYVVYGDYVDITRYTGEEEHVVIPEEICFRPVKALGVTYEKVYAIRPFEQNKIVKSIYVPDSVEKIGKGCFDGCENLESIRLSQNISELPLAVFLSCKSLKEIEIPVGVEVIGESAFVKCRSLQRIEIPDTVKVIGDGAFGQCDNLEEVIIPDSVEVIGWDAFVHTKYKASWTDKFVILGNQVLVDYSGKDEIVRVPEGVTFISTRMFEECEEMTQLILPSSVKKCEKIVFGCNNLKYVVINNPEMEFPNTEEFIRESPNAILIGSKGSTTEAYAKEYGYAFLESIPEE